MVFVRAKLTERDVEILGLAFQCLKDPNSVNVDYDKLAEAGNFKNAKSANASFLSVRKKLEAASSTISENPSTPLPKKAQGKATAKTNKSSEGVLNEDASNDSNAADNEKTPSAASPSKKPKTSRKPKAKATAIKNEDDAAAELSVVDEASNADNNNVETPNTPVKQKRKYNRKPKDSNAPPPAKRAKKQTATPTHDSAEADDNTNDPEPTNSVPGGGDAVKTEPADDEEGEGEEGEESVNGSGDRDGNGFSNMTASQAQIAAENALVPDAV